MADVQTPEAPVAAPDTPVAEPAAGAPADGELEASNEGGKEVCARCTLFAMACRMCASLRGYVDADNDAFFCRFFYSLADLVPSTTSLTNLVPTPQ